MANNDKPKTADDIEKELTATRFTLQQIRTIGFILGGLSAGYAAGRWGLAKIPGVSKKVGQWAVNGVNDWVANTTKMVAKQDVKLIDTSHPDVVDGATKVAEHYIIPGATAIGGYAVGQIASLYEHWDKKERERLSVEKIIEDTDKVVKSHIDFEDTLDRQAQAISAMRKRLESGMKSNKGEQVLASKEKSADRTH